MTGIKYSLEIRKDAEFFFHMGDLHQNLYLFSIVGLTKSIVW